MNMHRKVKEGWWNYGCFSTFLLCFPKDHKMFQFKNIYLEYLLNDSLTSEEKK